jgi:hypothetical protein
VDWRVHVLAMGTRQSSENHTEMGGLERARACLNNTQNFRDSVAAPGKECLPQLASGLCQRCLAKVHLKGAGLETKTQHCTLVALHL